MRKRIIIALMIVFVSLRARVCDCILCIFARKRFQWTDKNLNVDPFQTNKTLHIYLFVKIFFTNTHTDMQSIYLPTM